MMAHALKLKVVAEGVETRKQFNLLRDLDCDLFQGFLYSKPVEASEIALMLQEKDKKK